MLPPGGISPMINNKISCVTLYVPLAFRVPSCFQCTSLCVACMCQRFPETAWQLPSATIWLTLKYASCPCIVSLDCQFPPFHTSWLPIQTCRTPVRFDSSDRVVLKCDAKSSSTASYCPAALQAAIRSCINTISCSTLSVSHPLIATSSAWNAQPKIDRHSSSGEPVQNSLAVHYGWHA